MLDWCFIGEREDASYLTVPLDNDIQSFDNHFFRAWDDFSPLQTNILESTTVIPILVVTDPEGTSVTVPPFKRMAWRPKISRKREFDERFLFPAKRHRVHSKRSLRYLKRDRYELEMQSLLSNQLDIDRDGWLDDYDTIDERYYTIEDWFV